MVRRAKKVNGGHELQSLLIIGVLALAVVVSAIAGVLAKHQNRKLFTDLQVLTEERDRLEIDWGRLRLEQSTWSNHARVERTARSEMNMREPVAEYTRMIGQ